MPKYRSIEIEESKANQKFKSLPDFRFDAELNDKKFTTIHSKRHIALHSIKNQINHELKLEPHD